MAIIRKDDAAQIVPKKDAPKTALAPKTKGWLSISCFLPSWLPRIVRADVPCTCAKTNRPYLMRFAGPLNGSMRYLSARKVHTSPLATPTSPPVKFKFGRFSLTTMKCPYCKSKRVARCPSCKRFVCCGLTGNKKSEFTCACGKTTRLAQGTLRELAGTIALEAKTGHVISVEDTSRMELSDGEKRPRLPPSTKS